jgi:sRNA-binding protein
LQKYHNDPAALKKIDAMIGALSELFPAFRAQAWEEHQPLTCGIDRQLVDTGALSADEAGAVMHRYVRRRMYQVALAAGGPRYNLDGTIGGEVTPDQAQGALTMIAKIEARRTKAAEVAKAEWLAGKAKERPDGKPTSAEPTRHSPEKRTSSLHSRSPSRQRTSRCRWVPAPLQHRSPVCGMHGANGRRRCRDDQHHPLVR